MVTDIAIIGGGASGLTAAISAKEANRSAKVTIVEKLPRTGKKIIASNYIEEQKDYNNKTSQLTLKVSNFISKTFDRIMKSLFKTIENTVNG